MEKYFWNEYLHSNKTDRHDDMVIYDIIGWQDGETTVMHTAGLSVSLLKGYKDDL